MDRRSVSRRQCAISRAMDYKIFHCFLALVTLSVNPLFDLRRVVSLRIARICSKYAACLFFFRAEYVIFSSGPRNSAQTKEISFESRVRLAACAIPPRGGANRIRSASFLRNVRWLLIFNRRRQAFPARCATSASERPVGHGVDQPIRSSISVDLGKIGNYRDPRIDSSRDPWTERLLPRAKTKVVARLWTKVLSFCRSNARQNRFLPVHTVHKTSV